MRVFIFILILCLTACSPDDKEENALCKCLDIEEGQEVQTVVKETAENEGMQKCVKFELKKIIKKIKSAPEPKTALKESMKNLLDTECADIIFQEISLEEFLTSDLNSMDFLK